MAEVKQYDIEDMLGAKPGIAPAVLEQMQKEHDVVAGCVARIRAVEGCDGRDPVVFLTSTTAKAISANYVAFGSIAATSQAVHSLGHILGELLQSLRRQGAPETVTRPFETPAVVADPAAEGEVRGPVSALFDLPVPLDFKRVTLDEVTADVEGTDDAVRKASDFAVASIVKMTSAMRMLPGCDGQDPVVMVAAAACEAINAIYEPDAAAVARGMCIEILKMSGPTADAGTSGRVMQQVTENLTIYEVGEMTPENRISEAEFQKMIADLRVKLVRTEH